jgi:UDP-N-acetyl-D-galactosamine dehydrogenase
MNIDTHAVLKQLELKWNFLPFKPGLAGHCIGVADPIIWHKKAQELSTIPRLSCYGRRPNDSTWENMSLAGKYLLISKQPSFYGAKSFDVGDYL